MTVSASNNNVVLTLLAELGTQSNETAKTELTPAASPETQDEWSLYQSQIDTALKDNDVKQAAEIANHANSKALLKRMIISWSN